MRLGDDAPFDDAQLAAVAFLARYSGQTLDAYRQDLRSFFDWAGLTGLKVMAATRPHIELYRHHVEQRSLAPATIDRRLTTVCGFYRFAHIDGRISSNPAQYVRRPRVHPTEGRGLDRGELGRFLFTAERIDRPHAALAVLLGLNGLRFSEAENSADPTTVNAGTSADTVQAKLKDRRQRSRVIAAARRELEPR